MKKIAFIIPKGNIMPSTVLGPYMVFKETSDYLLKTRGKAAFDIKIYGSESSKKLYGGLFSIQPNGHFLEADDLDIVLLPAIFGIMEEYLKDNEELIGWLKLQYEEKQTELASLCSGTFLTAATGLLEKKKCTTHWAFEEDFKRIFPNVKLLSEFIIMEDSGIYSSGGAFSSLNLVLYLIEKFCGKQAADWATRFFEIDIDRHSQKPFMIFNQQKNHDDERIKNAQEYIEKHYSNDKIRVQDIANEFAFSRRNFVRRFKNATYITPIEYIQRVRVEAAKKMLEGSDKSISQIIGEVGYNDSKTFREVFNKYTGFSPSRYRARYQR